MDSNANTYRIPAVNFSRLEGEIQKINKKAIKLGCSPVVLTKIRTIVEKKKDLIFDMEYDFVVHECSVEGSAPQLEGWKLVATIDPQENGEVLVREVPGERCPAEYRKCTLNCDHCNKIRRRKNVFVLHHAEQGHKQIGRNCLADFLGGVDPEVFLANASYLNDFCRIASDAGDESWGWGGKGEQGISIDHFLSVVSIVVRRLGWMPRSKADPMNGSPASADVAWNVCTERDAKQLREYVNKYNLNVEDGDKKRAEEALAWGRAIDPAIDNTYLYDLGVACRQETVTFKNGGYVASVIMAHQRFLEKDLANKTQSAVSGYVGEIKKRKTFTLKIMSAHPYEGTYGVKTMVKMQDVQGNHFLWRASGNPDWIVLGDTFMVDATVKEHNEYRGVKQTVVDRVKPHKTGDSDASEEVGADSQSDCDGKS